MHSKARIAGYPLHPMLVAFPIALFTATIGLELAHIGTRDPFYYRAAMIANIAGLLTALLAAIPGAIDLYVLPTHSRARATGSQHAMFNLLTVALFAASALLLYLGWSGRVMVDGEYALNATIPLAFDTIGFIAMVIAASLGYALVHPQHVGVAPTFMGEVRAPPKLDSAGGVRSSARGTPHAGMRH